MSILEALQEDLRRAITWNSPNESAPTVRWRSERAPRKYRSKESRRAPRSELRLKESESRAYRVSKGWLHRINKFTFLIESTIHLATGSAGISGMQLLDMILPPFFMRRHLPGRCLRYNCLLIVNLRVSFLRRFVFLNTLSFIWYTATAVGSVITQSRVTKSRLQRSSRYIIGVIHDRETRKKFFFRTMEKYEMVGR